MEIFSEEYCSEIVNVTVVTNEVNQIQNDVPLIAWAVMNGEDHDIVEYFTDSFSAPTNMDNRSTQKNNFFLQSVLYFL